ASPARLAARGNGSTTAREDNSERKRSRCETAFAADDGLRLAGSASRARLACASSTSPARRRAAPVVAQGLEVVAVTAELVEFSCAVHGFRVATVPSAAVTCGLGGCQRPCSPARARPQARQREADRRKLAQADTTPRCLRPSESASERLSA